MLACCWFGSGFTFLRQFMSLLAEISHPQQVTSSSSFVQEVHCARGNALSWDRADHRTLKPETHF